MQKIQIDGPAGALEVVLHPALPDAPWAVICHPHPLFAGTMDNKVVTTIAKACNEAGLNALRFNFRGVGASAGQYDNAVGEVADALAVIKWLQVAQNAKQFVLAGFSFGSYVAAATSCKTDVDISHLLLVAPPVHHFPFADISTLPVPASVVMGDADEVVPFEEVDHWVNAQYPPMDYTVFSGCGHFFHGYLPALKEWVKQQLPPP